MRMLSDLQYRISLLEKVRPVPTGGFSSCQTGTACAGAETEFGAVDAAGALLFEVPELERKRRPEAVLKSDFQVV